MCTLGKSHDGFAPAGQKFFFMTTAVVSGVSADGFLTRIHLPQPPAPTPETASLLSAPQHESSGPRSSASCAEAAPVIQSDSP